MIHALQIRAARALTGLSQADLARCSGVGIATIKRIEVMTGDLRISVQTLLRIQRTLEAAGIVFIEQDDRQGPGVRLKTPLP